MRHLNLRLSCSHSPGPWQMRQYIFDWPLPHGQRGRERGPLQRVQLYLFTLCGLQSSLPRHRLHRFGLLLLPHAHRSRGFVFCFPAHFMLYRVAARRGYS